MAISWFCHGCLKDVEGEVPRDSKCESCRVPNIQADIIPSGDGRQDFGVQ